MSDAHIAQACEAVVAAANRFELLADEQRARLRMTDDVTLRDRFAMAALQGLLVHSQVSHRHGFPVAGEANSAWPAGFAEGSYILADAMLKARAAALPPPAATREERGA